VNRTITGPRRDRSNIMVTAHARGQTSDSDWDDRFEKALAGELRRRATRRMAAFWRLARIATAFASDGTASR
jgi:hypothetical protein